MQWLMYNIGQIMNSQETSHSSPSLASYGMSIVSILEVYATVHEWIFPFCIYEIKLLTEKPMTVF